MKSLNNKVNLSQQVAQRIMKMIQVGRLLPKNKIPSEKELSQEFGVSRTVIREALRSLSAIGAVEIMHGKGTFVCDSKPGPLRMISTTGDPPALDMLLDLLEFRKIIEPETAALAAERRSSEDITEMENCISDMENNIFLEKKASGDLGFHLVLAHTSHNRAIMDTSTLIAKFYSDDPYLPDPLDIVEHRAIFEAVKEGDTRKARQLMKAHLSRMIEIRNRVKSA